MAGPRYVMAEPSLQLVCGAVTAKLDTRRGNHLARAMRWLRAGLRPVACEGGFRRDVWRSESGGTHRPLGRASQGAMPRGLSLGVVEGAWALLSADLPDCVC